MARVVIALILAGLATACGSASVDDIDPGLLAVTPSYQRDIAPILRRYCVGCHDSRGTVSGGVALEQYLAARSNRTRSACVALSRELIDRYGTFLLPVPKNPAVETPALCGDWASLSMPVGAKDHLTTSEQVILLRWVELGGPP